MKHIKTLLLLFAIAAITGGCATSNGYSKTPPPCDSFAMSLDGDNPCGAKRKINW